MNLEQLRELAAHCQNRAGFGRTENGMLLWDSGAAILRLIDMVEGLEAQLEARVPDAPYGYCPVCRSMGEKRERSPNGHTYCGNGHKWLSSESLSAAPSQQAPHCATCNDNGLIGGPSYYAPDEGGVPCPDCSKKAPHPDDVAVDRFAEAMKQKLGMARAKGRGGWQTCSKEDLSRMLREHVEKGDPRDVANFCMFLHSLGHGIAQQAPVAQGEPVAWTNPGAKGKTFYEIMVQAHSFCPTELPHLQKMQWMASYYEVNRQQQASEPMTVEQIKAGWANSNARQHTYSLLSEQSFLEGVHFAERHHNIKGKQ